MVAVGELLGYLNVVLSFVNTVGVKHVQHFLRVVALPKEGAVPRSSALIDGKVRQENRGAGFDLREVKLCDDSIRLSQNESLLEVGLCLLLLKRQMAYLCHLLVLASDSMKGVVQKVVLHELHLEYVSLVLDVALPEDPLGLLLQENLIRMLRA